MIRDGIDPTILDFNPEQSLASQRPPTDEIQPNPIDPKYFKMLEVVRSLPILSMKFRFGCLGFNFFSFNLRDFHLAPLRILCNGTG